MTPEQLELKRRFPTSMDLRRRARKRLPNFAFEYLDGGAGGADNGIARNWGAFESIEMIPRYGKVVGYLHYRGTKKQDPWRYVGAFDVPWASDDPNVSPWLAYPLQ